MQAYTTYYPEGAVFVIEDPCATPNPHKFPAARGIKNIEPVANCFLPSVGGSLGCAQGCDTGGREFETPTGPTLRVFK